MFQDNIPEGTYQAKFMLSDFYPAAQLPGIGNELGIQIVFTPGIGAAVNTVNMEAAVSDDPKILDAGSIAYDSYVCISTIVNYALSHHKKGDKLSDTTLKSELVENEIVWNAIKMFIANYYMYRNEIYSK